MTILDSVRRHARDKPESVAALSTEGSISYLELERKSNALAGLLMEQGLQPEEAIAVLLPPGPHLLVALLGIWKAGGVYLPLSINLPDERLGHMVEAADALTLVTTSSYLHRIPGAGQLVLLEEDLEGPGQDLPLNFQVTPSFLAYVMFTSGSTGAPKAVAVEHASISHIARELSSAWRMEATDRVLQFAAPIWDTSFEEMLPALHVGASIAFPRPEAKESTARFWQECGLLDVSIVDLPTAFWSELAKQTSPDTVLPLRLRLVVIGGERANPTDVRQWLKRFPATELWNSYGCTETTAIAALVHLSLEHVEEGEVPIGYELPGVRIHVVTEDLEEAGCGSEGEIVVGGLGVARGYLNTDEGSERFRLFSNGERVYMTGDRGRLRPSGMLECLGRTDSQVKVRGVRIELAEVEAALTSHPDVRGAVVVTRADRIGQYLEGFVTGLPGNEVDIESVRKWAGARLVPEAAPRRIFVVSEFPLTATGKLDRAALRDTHAFSEFTPDETTSEEERLVLALWQNILEVTDPSLEVPFKSYGADSLMTARMLFDVHERTGVLVVTDTPPQDLTVREIAQLIRDDRIRG